MITLFVSAHIAVFRRELTLEKPGAEFRAKL